MSKFTDHYNWAKLWKSFLDGVGSAFNLFPEVKLPEGVEKSDAEAIEDDWRKVGEDFRKAMREVDRKYEEKE